MDKDYIKYFGSSDKDNWVFIFDNEYIKQRGGFIESNMYNWNVNPEEISYSKNICIRVFSASFNELPSFVLKSKNIVYLGMPLRIFRNIDPKLISDSVKTLHIMYNDDDVFEIPEDWRFHQIERFAGNNIVFRIQNFPKLIHISVDLDKKGIMIDRIICFEKLLSLQLSNYANDIFEKLSKLKNLGYLRLNRNSTIETLNGIEAIESLTDLWIQDWKKLIDVSKLKYLPKLECLTIGDSKKIKYAESILEIKSLKQFTVWGCNKETFVPIVERLQQNGCKVSCTLYGSGGSFITTSQA